MYPQDLAVKMAKDKIVGEITKGSINAARLLALEDAKKHLEIITNDRTKCILGQKETIRYWEYVIKYLSH